MAKDWTKAKICPICGKAFWLTSKEEWQFKRGKCNCKLFCTWSCMREYDRRKEEARKLGRKRKNQETA